MKKVISVNPLNDGRVLVRFSDGLAGEFDVKPYMKSAFLLGYRLASGPRFGP
jgi:hypothetical protein